MPNPVQSFIDSPGGIVIGTTLHTAGAILMLGGLAAFIAWRRALFAGQHHEKLIAGAAAATYLALLANLVGGFMRTYEEGHPHLTQIADSPWVQVLTLKHVALFAGMGVAVWLVEVHARRLLRAHREGNLAQAPSAGSRAAVLFVAATILLAAILGSVSKVVPLLDGAAAEGMDGDGHDGHPMELPASFHNATGQLTSTPVRPAESTGSFEVANGTASLDADLVWSPDAFELSIELVDPTGQAAATGQPSGGTASATVEAPSPGRWTYRIRSGLAVDAQWTLSIRMSGAGQGFHADEVAVLPGQFYEINTVMPRNGTLHWDWTVAEGTAIHFDVHSHFDGDVQYWVEEDAASGSGAYTNGREGGYSFLWENTAQAPVTLQYRVWGDFEVDSIFP